VSTRAWPLFIVAASGCAVALPASSASPHAEPLLTSSARVPRVEPTTNPPRAAARAADACGKLRGYEDVKQSCIELRRDAVALGSSDYRIIWRKRSSELGLLGYEVLVLRVEESGWVQVESARFEQLSGAGLEDEIPGGLRSAEPRKSADGLRAAQRVTIRTYCRGFYEIPGDESSRVPSGACGDRIITVVLSDTQATIGSVTR